MSIEDIKFEPPISLVQKIVKDLTEAILDGRLRPKEQLKEISLTKQLGVSRFAIREAFRTLEEQDLILSIPRKGCFVREITPKDIKELIPVRAMLEGYAAELACPRLETKHFSQFESSFENMTHAAQENDLRLFLRNHYEFHRIYIEASCNNALQRILIPMLNRNIWYRHITDNLKFSYEYSINKHREILKLFRKKDALKARLLVEEHIIGANKSLLKGIIRNAASVVSRLGNLKDINVN